MEFKQITPAEVECTVSEDELRARGIDPAKCTCHTPEIRALFKDIKDEAILKYDIKANDTPLIIEAIPTDNSLLVILSWIDDLSDSLNAHYSTFFDPDEAADDVENDSDIREVAVPEEATADTSLDELQNEIITDITTSLGNGRISETLKKYLNEDFLKRLRSAAPNGGLDGLFNTLFSDFSTPDAKSGSARPSSEKEEKNKIARRLEKYMDSIGSGTGSSDDTSIIEISFMSIDEAQTALERLGFTDFHGESVFIKEGPSRYTLFLRPGPLSLHDFQMETQLLSIQPNASFSSKERLVHLLEHEEPIIPCNAVKLLMGEN